MRLATLSILVGACTIGCMPKSLILGQTAKMPKSGTSEVTLSAGPGFIHTSPPSPPAPFPTSPSANAFVFPDTEGDVVVGITDRIAVNVRAGAAGLQPGIKFGLQEGSLAIALLPEASFQDLYSTNTGLSGLPQVGTNPNIIGILAGGKIIASIPGGLYGAVGYDYQYMHISASVMGQNADSHATSHNLTFNLGYEFDLNGTLLRPEIAFLWVPSISQTSAGINLRSGSGWTLLPSLTVALDNY